MTHPMMTYPRTVKGLATATATATEQAQRHNWTFHVVDRRDPSSHRRVLFVTPNGFWDYRGTVVFTAEPLA